MKSKKNRRSPYILQGSLMTALILLTAMLDARIAALIAIAMFAWYAYRLAFVEKDMDTLRKISKAALIALVAASFVVLMMHVLPR